MAVHRESSQITNSSCFKQSICTGRTMLTPGLECRAVLLKMFMKLLYLGSPLSLQQMRRCAALQAPTGPSSACRLSRHPESYTGPPHISVMQAPHRAALSLLILHCLFGPDEALVGMPFKLARVPGMCIGRRHNPSMHFRQRPKGLLISAWHTARTSCTEKTVYGQYQGRYHGRSTRTLQEAILGSYLLRRLTLGSSGRWRSAPAWQPVSCTGTVPSAEGPSACKRI